MTYNFPDYSNLDLASYDHYYGSAVLAFIKQHCDDIAVVAPDEWKSYENFQWLDDLLTQYLNENKKVLLVPNEEIIIFAPHIATSLDKYQDKNVWLVTQLGGKSQLIYSFQNQFKIKLIEIPYVLLELCEEYYRIHCDQQTVYDNNYNFLCMTGRYDQHKGDLVKALFERNLDKQGLITIAADRRYPEWFKNNCVVNDLPIISSSREYFIRSLISGNVLNFLEIEHRYKDIPLILHAETNCGIFYTTEKSLWPLLMGKLYLGFGPPDNMKYIQRFYDFPFENYLDLTYDEQPDDWSIEGQKNRINIMIEKNYDLIFNCKNVYNKFCQEIESARWSIGKNFYNFFTAQLQTLA